MALAVAMSVPPPKRENLLFNIVCNIAVPSVVLTWGSKAAWLGPKGALIVALALAIWVSSRLKHSRMGHALAAIAAVVLGTAWIGLLSYRHVDYAHELWWQFALDGNAPRALRSA